MSQEIRQCFQMAKDVSFCWTRHGRDMRRQTKPRSSLPLPPAIRKRFEERLTECRRTWEETGDPLAVAEAISWVYFHRQTIPPWLEDAAIRSLARLRTDQQARRHREAMRHWGRWRWVKDGIEDGLTWDQAYDRAARMLAGDAEVDVESIRESVRKSYQLVQRKVRSRRTGEFWFLKDRRYRHLG
jgi:hypothetical protein